MIEFVSRASCYKGFLFDHSPVVLRLQDRFEIQRPPIAMVHAVHQQTLADIAKEAAAGPQIQEYLDLRGVKTTATLALLGKDEDSLDRTLIQPLLQGWLKPCGTAKIEIPASEHPIAKAVITHMWLVAKQAMQQVIQQAQQPTVPPPSTTTTPSASTSEDKVPKTLAPGRWTTLVGAYQKQQLGGLDRRFPTHELLGSEHIIARMLHEFEVSKLFTPVGLGEIISSRTFLPTGEPNPLAKKDRSTGKLRLAEDGLETLPETPWEPRSLMAILDGLQSIRWAYILTAMAPEQVITQFFDWMVKLCRSRPSKTDQLSQFWHSTSWKIAIAMRSGSTFEEAVATVMRDYDSFSECMGRESTLKQPKTPAKPVADSHKGSGKTNTKSNKTRPSSWSRSPRASWSQNQQDRQQSPRHSQPYEDKSSWGKRDWSDDWHSSRK